LARAPRFPGGRLLGTATVPGACVVLGILAVECASFAGEEGLPVFPEAQGFGIRTPAGRGGKVIKVTTLAREGDGSLRAALEAKGPRVVVFEVAGVIDLRRSMLVIREPFVTVAGQTAPSPGVTVIGGGIQVRTRDVVIRHLRVRPGDKGGRGFEPDAISVGASDGSNVSNVVVDHCSFSWAIDENASVSGKNPCPHDVTYSNCIVAEGLSRATHSKGEHSKGTLVMDGCERVAIIRCLYAHNLRRSPYLKSGTSAVVVNNVIYDPGELALHLSRFGGRAPVASVVANVFIAGRSTPKGLGLISSMGGGILVHARENLALDVRGGPRPLLTKGGAGQVRKWNARSVRLKDSPPVWVEPLDVIPADQVARHLAENVGARPRDRDPVDRRIVAEVSSGGGRIINSQSQVGGHPRVRAVSRRLTIPADPGGDADGDGYTNLEEWLHEKARALERPWIGL
jgi:pectate lyase